MAGIGSLSTVADQKVVTEFGLSLRLSARLDAGH
jgi:hypothetical protein